MQTWKLIEKIDETLMKAKTRFMGKTLMGHRLVVKGYVEVRNGDKLLFRSRNHFVGVNIISLANTFSSFAGLTTQPSMPIYGFTSLDSFMVIGTDTATSTVWGTTGLTAPIGTAPGTKPNTQACTLSTDNSTKAKITLTSTWNAGTVSGTVGEIGLYSYALYETLSSTATTANGLISRLSAKDADFTAFTINTANALAITWVIEFSFA